MIQDNTLACSVGMMLNVWRLVYSDCSKTHKNGSTANCIDSTDRSFGKDFSIHTSNTGHLYLNTNAKKGV